MSDTLTILGSKIDKVTQAEALNKIGEFIHSREPHYIVTANAEIIYQASRDQKMQQVVNRADLVTADGSGVVWAGKYLGCPLEERVTGIDLVTDICAESQKKGWRIYILGAAPGIAEKAALKIVETYPKCQIVGYHHGYFQPNEETDILQRVFDAKPDVLLVALGAPRQEYWIVDHMCDLRIPVSMGIGGALDVLSGNVKRAPQWMQRLSLEWLYRVLIQPGRWKRVLALPKFVLAVIKSAK